MTINQLAVGILQTNCWIISLYEGAKNSESIVVDPGGDADLILNRLEKLSLHPRYIVFTHAHFDHLTALPQLFAAYPDTEIAIHQAEAAKLGPASFELHKQDLESAGAPFYISELRDPLPPASLLLSEGDTIGPFTIMHVPGHSPGSICLYSKEEKTLISGDTLFKGDFGRSDLPGGNRRLLGQSLQRLSLLDDDTAVYPGHGPVTKISQEKAVFMSI